MYSQSFCTFVYLSIYSTFCHIMFSFLRSFFFFFFKQKTAYEMRISDWSSDVCSSDLRLLLGGALAAAAAVAALWLLRPPSDPVEVALPFASTTAPSLTTTTVDAPAQLVVHVAGAVVAPGVHEVPADGRVVDAIDAAGGLAPGADSARINLAAPVADGERVYVPVVGEEPPPAVVGGPGATGPRDRKSTRLNSSH